VKIKDVFLLNEILNEVDKSHQSHQSQSKSLFFLFEKLIEVEVKNNANNLDKDINYRIERIICKTDYECWDYVLEFWDSFKYPYIR
jgi:hypothetical protein